MTAKAPKLELRTSPHVKRGVTVERIMFNVVLALLPIALFSVWQYGLSALALIVTVTLTCLLSERLFNHLGGQSGALSDW